MKKSILQPLIDASVLSRLACPACLGDLRVDGPQPRLICLACGRTYPIVDGIPVLIAGRNQPG